MNKKRFFDVWRQTMKENKNKKHIELFPGSIRDLERLTGKLYRSMKDENDNPIKIDLKSRRFGEHFYDRTVPPSSRNVADQMLTEEAEKLGADALVHVTYPREGHSTFVRIPAFGYAAKLQDPES